MDVLFFAFANNPKEPLENLQKEADEIRRVLSAGVLEQRYLIHFDPYATREKLIYYLSLYRERITLFHYSGHAGKDVLVTEGEAAQAEGIAHILGQCPQLRWVFLNGCSTQGQVQGLWEKGISGILSTNSPVGDDSASQFAQRLYQALAAGEDWLTAYELAKGDLLSKVDNPTSFSSIGTFVLQEDTEGALLPWKLYLREGREELNNWRLPERVQIVVPMDFTPNTLLIETLSPSLAPYARELRFLQAEEEEGEAVDIADKRLAILNCLPAPVAEQLRKLMVPFSDASKGYDKISLARAEQLVKTYTTLIELLTFTLLAQLWEATESQERVNLNPEQAELLKEFLHTRSHEKEFYDFLPVLRGVGEILQNNGIEYFIEELAPLHESYHVQSPFVYACHYLNALKRRVEKEGLAEHEIGNACVQGEQQLAVVFQELGFLANYTMAAIRKIDVVKYRHMKEARYSHSLVRLVKLMGGLELKEEELESFMDNRSVLLIKKKKKDTPGKRYMNLSPFVIDQNAFDKKPTDISKVYFFFSYDPDIGKYSFRHVDKPDDLPLVIPKENYEVIPDQFDYFTQILFQKPMAGL